MTARRQHWCKPTACCESRPRRLSLSSIRCPRIYGGNAADKSEAYGLEAKEALRKALIGKRVRVVPEPDRISLQSISASLYGDSDGESTPLRGRQRRAKRQKESRLVIDSCNDTKADALDSYSTRFI